MALKPTIREVLARLQSQGSLPADAGERAAETLGEWRREHGESPWYLRVLIGGGAWFAALFLGSALALILVSTGLADSEDSFIVLGLLAGGAGLWLRILHGGDFTSQLALALSLAGQALLLGGVQFVTRSDETTALTMLAVSAFLLFVYPDPIHRFLSAVSACGAALYLLHGLGSWIAVEAGAVAIAAALHLHFHREAQLRRGRFEPVVTPAGFALASTLFGVLLLRTFNGNDPFASSAGSLAPSPLLTLGLAAVTLYSASRMLEEHGVPLRSTAGVTVLVALGLTAALTLRTPGVIAAAGVLALAFHRRAILLLGLGVVFLLAFGALYYYDLALSLLAKSGALIGSGLALLALRQFVVWRFPAEPAPEVG